MTNNTNQTDSASTWWRWPLIPFACFVGASLGSIAMGYLQWFGMKFSGGFTTDGWYYLYILPIITSASFGWLWTLIATEVAPKSKKTTGIVMTTLLGTVFILAILISFNNPAYEMAEKIQSALGGLAMMIAAIVTLSDVKE